MLPRLELTLMMRGLDECFIRGMKAWVISVAPNTLVSKIVRISSRLGHVSSLSGQTPALLIRLQYHNSLEVVLLEVKIATILEKNTHTSNLPASDITLAIIAMISSSLVTSALKRSEERRVGEEGRIRWLGYN